MGWAATPVDFAPASRAVVLGSAPADTKRLLLQCVQLHATDISLAQHSQAAAWQRLTQALTPLSNTGQATAVAGTQVSTHVVSYY